jgi:hypothetical protein
MIQRIAALAPGLGAAERLWWSASIICLIAFVAMAMVQRFDPRLLGGQSVWAKPLKFALSTAIHFGSIALVVHWLRPAWSASQWMTALAILSVAAAAFEVGYIMFQAARGLPSHFNVTTPSHAALWSLMAAAAVIVLAPMGAIGLLAAVDGEARWPAAVRLGVALGMFGSVALTLVTAFRIGANMSHFIGPPPLADRLVPWVGWSLNGADLRPAHFLATHMAQVIPLAALVLTRLVPGTLAVPAVAGMAIGWTTLTVLVFAYALSGRSLVSLVTP